MTSASEHWATRSRKRRAARRRGAVALIGALWTLGFSSSASAEANQTGLSHLVAVCDALRDTPSERRADYVASLTNIANTPLKEELRTWLETRNSISIRDAEELSRTSQSYAEQLIGNEVASARLLRLEAMPKSIVMLHWSKRPDSSLPKFKAAAESTSFSYELSTLDVQLSWLEQDFVNDNSPRKRHDGKYSTQVAGGRMAIVIRTNRDLELGPLRLERPTDTISVGSEFSEANPSEAVTWINLSLYPNATLN